MIEEQDIAKEPFSPSDIDEETELRALTRALQLAEGFTLIFARCNQAPHRKELIESLRSSLPDFNIQEIHLDHPVPHLLDELRARIANPMPDAIFVSGIEYSLPVAAEAHNTPFVANLNAARDSFRQVISCPLVLWIPEYALIAIMRGAPDFFSIRSGAYYFANTIKLPDKLLSGSEWESSNLTLEDKIERIEAIASLMSEYENLPTSQRDFKTEAKLHQRLGNLFYFIGNYEASSDNYRQMLKLAENVNDKILISRALHNLANIYELTNESSKANELFQQSIKIAREIGDVSGAINTLIRIGNQYVEQMKYESARQIYEEALEMTKAIGNHIATAQVLGNIGVIYQRQGMLDKATIAYQQSLTLSRQTNDLTNQAGGLINLGQVYQLQGNVLEAEKSYKESLQIAKKLGSLRLEIECLSLLGVLFLQEGRLAESETCLQSALALCELVGDRKKQGDLLFYLSTLRASQLDFSSALALGDQALQIFDEINDSLGSHNTKIYLQTLREQQKEVEKSGK